MGSTKGEESWPLRDLTLPVSFQSPGRAPRALPFVSTLKSVQARPGAPGGLRLPRATLPVGARPAAPAGTGEAVLPLLHLATSAPKEFALEPEWPLVCPSPAGCQAGMIRVPRKERGSEPRRGLPEEDQVQRHLAPGMARLGPLPFSPGHPWFPASGPDGPLTYPCTPVISRVRPDACSLSRSLRRPDPVCLE